VPSLPNSSSLKRDDLAARLHDGTGRCARCGRGPQGTDIIKITCLDDKLDSDRCELRTVEGRLDGLKKAVDSDRRTTSFTVLTVLAEVQVSTKRPTSASAGYVRDRCDQGCHRIDTSMLPYEEDPSNPPGDSAPSFANRAAAGERKRIGISFSRFRRSRMLETLGQQVPAPQETYPGRCVLAFLGSESLPPLHSWCCYARRMREPSVAIRSLARRGHGIRLGDFELHRHR